jgi:hypothetical protein
MSDTTSTTESETDSRLDDRPGSETGSASSRDAAGTDSGAAPGPRSTAAGTDPPYDCSYCDRQFHRTAYLALHRGQAHGDELAGAEKRAYESAREDEEEELRLFRLQALAALVFIYFGFLLVYAFSL